MKTFKYNELKRDFNKLELLNECEDWGSAEEHFIDLLENPNNKIAGTIYLGLIQQWLLENSENDENSWAYDKYY